MPKDSYNSNYNPGPAPCAASMFRNSFKTSEQVINKTLVDNSVKKMFPDHKPQYSNPYAFARSDLAYKKLPEFNAAKVDDYRQQARENYDNAMKLIDSVKKKPSSVSPTYPKPTSSVKPVPDPVKNPAQEKPKLSREEEDLHRQAREFLKTKSLDEIDKTFANLTKDELESLYPPLALVHVGKSIDSKLPHDLPKQKPLFLFSAEKLGFVYKPSYLEEASLYETAAVAVGRSIMKTSQGMKQLGLNLGESMGFIEEGATKKYTEQVNQEKQIYDDTPVAKSFLGQVIEIGADIGQLAIPGTGITKVTKVTTLGGTAAAGAAGAMMGFVQPTEDGALLSNAKNSVIEGAVSALTVFAVGKAGEIIKARIVKGKLSDKFKAFKKIVPPAIENNVMPQTFSEPLSKPLKFSETKIVNSAGKANAAQAAKLAKALEARTCKSIFTRDGFLTDSAIEEAKILILGKDFTKGSPIEVILSKRGNINDWSKCRTQKFSTPEPSKNLSKSLRNIEAEVHFYKNNVTGEVYYGKDFKVKYDKSCQPQLPVSEFLSSLPTEWKIKP